MSDRDESNLVEPQDGCPLCSERSADRLVWLDDERVECQMCGSVYTPNAAKPGDDA